jgi:hypothetical protein
MTASHAARPDRRPPARAVVGAVLAAVVVAVLAATPTAAANIVGGASSLAMPASAAAGQPFTATARFVQPGGSPFPLAVAVIFSEDASPAGSCAATFDPQFASTDATGSASTQVTLSAGCPGNFVLLATAAGAGSVTTTITETGGFPNTSADPPGGPAWPWAPAPAVIGVLLGAAALVLLRRIVASR